FKLCEDLYAYIQPDGSWGLSNTGLITGRDSALLIDTLYDYKHTSEMLQEMEGVLSKNSSIEYVINTHGNGDHWYGNSLINSRAQIISTDRAFIEMKKLPPGKMNLLMKLSFLLGKGGKYAKESFKEFRYTGISPRYPDRKFSGETELSIGDLRIRLIELGPAHTQGDAIVYIPDKGVVFTGDLLFINTTPIAWESPLSNTIKACDYLLDIEADVYVPGHGPVTDKSGVQSVKNYFEYIYDKGKKLLMEGYSIIEAARKIDLKEYNSWIDKERLAANLYCIYKELHPEEKGLSPISVFKLMKEFKDTM
ncbi:MAG: MBL fold metallo-hydrolase, partial [Chitinivibrionales bacterium]